MSVQTQIDRISGAVSDALAALTEKGVTVPDGTKVDGLADLIAAIESGGGGGGTTGENCAVSVTASSGAVFRYVYYTDSGEVALSDNTWAASGEVQLDVAVNTIAWLKVPEASGTLVTSGEITDVFGDSSTGVTFICFEVAGAGRITYTPPGGNPPR